MTLPADLLQAVSDPGGGKITLILGAGCSFEAPTSIPLAGTCSQESHDRLVANGVLSPGDCSTPSDLSCLADSVVAKSGDQKLLVDQLRQHYFQSSTPNEGYSLAAALLREGAVASVVTLNFDLALSAAIDQLGVGDKIGIINGPDDLPKQKAINLYYLHRNTVAIDPDQWVLRTEALQSEWKGTWQSIVAARVLSTPFVVFAGLGSPAAVLIESVRLIQAAVPNASRIYQVDPVDHSKSAFFTALGLDPSAYIQVGWCDFMDALSHRVVAEQAVRLNATASGLVQRNHLASEDLTLLLARIEEIGLLQLGSLRACWLLHERPYWYDEPIGRELVADLLLAGALIARVRAVTAVLFEDGVVEFRRGNQSIASYIFVSGRGTRSRSAIEADLSTRRRRFRGRATPPMGAIVSGITDLGTMAITNPSDIVLGDTSTSITSGQPALSMFHVAALRLDPSECALVVP
jgi:hypothetical protein